MSTAPESTAAIFQAAAAAAKEAAKRSKRQSVWEEMSVKSRSNACLRVTEGPQKMDANQQHLH